VLREVEDARSRIADPASALSRQLASVSAGPNPGELSVGTTVEIHSLLRAPELNGVRGEIVGPLPQDPEAEAKRNAEEEEANRKWCQVTKATDGGGHKLEQLNAKFNLANDLKQQGAYEEALALYQEALEEEKEALALLQEAEELYTVAKMSVGAIKEELSARGIDATGNKAALVARLTEALDNPPLEMGREEEKGAAEAEPQRKAFRRPSARQPRPVARGGA
jgi:tetratricopeptide (TPR) repeat protein